MRRLLLASILCLVWLASTGEVLAENQQGRSDEHTSSNVHDEFFRLFLGGFSGFISAAVVAFMPIYFGSRNLMKQLSYNHRSDIIKEILGHDKYYDEMSAFVASLNDQSIKIANLENDLDSALFFLMFRLNPTAEDRLRVELRRESRSGAKDALRAMFSV